jgi:hypothetical protein
MAIISQKQIFNWKMVETSSELQRLELVLGTMPDEGLMLVLEAERKGRRDDNPIRSTWNTVIAGIVFGHESVASLRRELLRNGELRQTCGLDVAKGEKSVPKPSVYSNFLRKLFRHQDLIEAMFDELVAKLCELLPGFGKRLAVDSKKLESYSVGKKDPQESSDPEAAWGVKEYSGVDENGRLWKQVKSWFGYKVHLIVDSVYELPVAYELTKASSHDSPQLLSMVEKLKTAHPELLEGAEYLSADKGYDSAENNEILFDNYGINPVIGIRSMWSDEPELPRLLLGDFDNIFYTEKGAILCRYLSDENLEESKKYAKMAFKGFEKSRGTLKYCCPAKVYGIKCKQIKECRYGRVVRVPINKDRRIFTPIARSSYKWAREYKRRTAVERINSRLDMNFGFEKHYIRGFKKMRCRMGLSLVVMLAVAVGRIKANRAEDMRSLVKKVA